MSEDLVSYVDFKTSDWEIVTKSEINEPKVIALIENASAEVTYTDGNKRTIYFKRGTVIKIVKNPSGISNVWDPDDVITDTTTR